MPALAAAQPQASVAAPVVGAVAGGIVLGAAAGLGARMLHATGPRTAMIAATGALAGLVGGALLGRSLGAHQSEQGPPLSPSSGATRPELPPTVLGVTDPESDPQPAPFRLEQQPGTYASPVHVTSAPGDARGLYVVEQAGRIVRSEGAARSTFLDIERVVGSGGERGLLSVAFHPDYARNGKLYVNYTDRDGDTHIAELRARDGRADASSMRDLMKIDQPYGNHNGGQLQFGPDGNLYIGMGDGGSGDDPQNRAQDPQERLGKMLRIDVDHPANGAPYGVPADNPFRDGGGAPEIWASGLRNPWRFSFDRDSGDLWIGDVGQGQREEIDMLPAGAAPGANFGWDVREGTSVHDRSETLGPGRLIDPVLEYGHDEGAAITGGYVYRGADIPQLRGSYIYADIASNEIRSLRIADGHVTDRQRYPVGADMMVSFGEDARGELYVATISGSVFKFRPSAASPPATAPEAVGHGNDSGRNIALGVQPGAYRFDRDEIHVAAGRVTLRLTNNDRDGVPHNIGVRGFGVQEVGGIASPGQSSTVTVDLTAGKTYEFFCSPHEGMGMTGRIIVDG